ncbi:MAG: hypothetical protein ACJ74U_13325 [Jatrophihabitantaceae bacterium]
MEEPGSDEPEATIFIICFSDTGLWHAVWGNRDGFVADYDSADEAEILAWARERCDRIWVRGPGDEDYVRLPDEHHPVRPTGIG